MVGPASVIPAAADHLATRSTHAIARVDSYMCVTAIVSVCHVLELRHPQEHVVELAGAGATARALRTAEQFFSRSAQHAVVRRAVGVFSRKS